MYYHWSQCRKLSIRELARLQSFPDEYEWPEDYGYALVKKCIGNAVPPLMMRAIASTLREKVLAHGAVEAKDGSPTAC